jgi:hypothetical protein
MSGVFDDQELSAECPECGAAIRMTVREARRSPTRTCPNGHEVSFQASDLDRKLKDTERQLKKLTD